MLERVTYKIVLDSEGYASYLEIWQGNNHINVSLAGQGTHRSNYRWDEIKATVDKIQTRVTEETAKGLNSDFGEIMDAVVNETVKNTKEEK